MKHYLVLIFIFIFSGNIFCEKEIKTIKWKKDNSGFIQYWTNDIKADQYTLCHTSVYKNKFKSIEIIVNKISGNNDFAYGLVFGYKNDNNFWYISINVNGMYWIGKVINNKVYNYDINNEKWRSDIDNIKKPISENVIKGYDKENKIKIIKKGNSFTVYFNDKEEATFKEYKLTSGKIGASVGYLIKYENFPNIPVDFKYKILKIE